MLGKKILEAPVPHLNLVCWVPRAIAELVAKAVTRNKLTIKFNSLDKMFQLLRNTAIRKICFGSSRSG